MKATQNIRGSGRLAALVAATSVLALLASLVGGTARAATDGTAGMCPPAGALVTYASYGWPAGGKTVVVQPDGRVWVCWAARGGSGRTGFVLSKTELDALRAQLRQIAVRHLGSPLPRPCCDAPV